MLRLLVLTAALSLAMSGILTASPVVFVVRHAEKAATGGNDPDLSPAGQKRADALAQMLKDAGINAIFTTEFKRTQQTAAPLAKAINVTPTMVPGRDMAALAEKLRALNGNALVVGHTNTIPELLKALGLENAIAIPDDDYSELLIVTTGDKPQVVRVHYPF